MSKTKKIITVLAGIAVLCAVVAGFLRVFWNAFPREAAQPPQLSEETVYYAPLETEPSAEPTIPTQTLPPETVPETAPMETASETVPPETVQETVEQTVPDAERKTYDTVPNFYETDYPEIRFGSGSFADYGSGVTSVAMVATYLTGYEYLPDQLAAWFSNYIGNQIQILEHISDELQLPWKPAGNFHVALQALREGKVVIALMGQNSIFTTGQHFIVLTGINDAGKIMVNDPNRNNYSKWNLEKAFSEGFREGDILCGYSGAWIYDPAAVPEEPFLYQSPDPEVECRYPGLELSEEDTELLVKMIWAEAQSEPFDGQQAIAEVVLNRVAAENFPNTVRGVLYAPDQFKAMNKLYAAKPTHIQYEAVRRALNGPYVVPKDVVFFASFAVNKNIWGTIGNHTFCHQW